MEDFIYKENSIVCTENDQVYIQIEQTGIPKQLITKLPVLNPINFGVQDTHKNTIMYLDVDEITEFYHVEYGRVFENEEVPEEIKEKILGSFFLFRKVKRDVINQKYD